MRSELEKLATEGKKAKKCSRRFITYQKVLLSYLKIRDIAGILMNKQNGSTTVAATM